MSRAASARSGSFSIGEVLGKLRSEFPDVTISKIRFLEAEGLIEPQRAPSGYRKFSHDDIERLRFVLTSQRDHYLPLRVIKDHLEAIDRGLDPPQLPGSRRTAVKVPRVVFGDDGQPSAATFRDGGDVQLSREELIHAAEIDAALLDQLESYGLVVHPHGRDHYDGDAVVIAKIAGELAGFGLEPRHLRSFRTAAEREIGLVEQVVAPLLRQRNPDSRARAEEMTREMAALLVRLHAILVKVGLYDGRGR